MKKILTVVGTRPNLIKITQFHKLAKSLGFDHKLVHTGQHFDRNMNDIFFEELELPLPDFSMQVDKTSTLTQIAGMMVELEKVCLQFQPAIILVVGDVNSTFAAAFVANKLVIKCAHIESGLRSFDKEMPEENNRLLTDAIADYFFVTEQSGYNHLIAEGKEKEKIFFVGNTMIDTLVAFDGKIKQSNILESLKLESQKYILLTMHRPSNVDNKEGLEKILSLIAQLKDKYDVVFPIHPRTRANFSKFGLQDKLDALSNLKLIEPAGYIDFQKLIMDSRLVLTDSGGIQEETTFRQVPCLTLRLNTERPSTVDIGTNTLMKFENEAILGQILAIEKGEYKSGKIPPYWDGDSSKRIFEVLNSIA